VRTTRPLLPALAAAATLAAAAPTHAAPSLPAGWIAGGPAARMPAEVAPSPRSREGRALAASPRRPALAPVPLTLEAFDLVDVEPMLTTEEVQASNADSVGEPATDVYVDKGCTNASLAGHAIGNLQLGSVSEAIGPHETGGPDLYQVRGSHGSDGLHRFALAQWETLDRLPDGTIRVTQGSGRFTLLTCKTILASRFAVVARPILGGLAYLFRTRCARCGLAGREDLHVLTPQTRRWGGSLPYTHHVVSLDVDGADSAVVQVERFRVGHFASAFGPAPMPRQGQDMLIGVEVARGLGEAAPSLIAYASGVPYG
jgi:hypothetical protein